MSAYQTTATHFAIVDGLKVAYRRVGSGGEVPLIYLNHLRGSMDTIDPLLVNSIAKNRELIVYDSFGVGHSEGEMPLSIEEMASVTVKLLEAINISHVDIIGFSMGGFIAQYIAWTHPNLVRRLVLAGTQSAIGEGVAQPSKEVLEGAGDGEAAPTLEQIYSLFYYDSDSSRALADAWWERIHERQVPGEPRKEYVRGPGAQNQLNAIFTFTTTETNFDKLKDVQAPTLVTNGHTDVMVPTVNSLVLQQNLKNAELHLYPDSGHGHLFQEPELYAKNLETFLSMARS
jgi:pimeloyl-ACP methyl ester carboxylesterase